MHVEHKRRTRILITSVGSLVGQNVLDALALWRDDYFVIGLNSQADAVSNFLCDTVYLSDPIGQDGRFEKRLNEVVLLEAPELIIPGRDDDVVFLADWAKEHECWRSKAMVGSPEIARVLRDKLLTSRLAKFNDLPFVETLCAEDGFAAVLSLVERNGWPIVAKPRKGNASQGVVLVSDANELAVAFDWKGYCFQPWLGPPPDLTAIKDSLAGGLPIGWSLPGILYFGLHGYIAANGIPGAVFCTRHTEPKLGRSERVEAMHSDVARGIAESYASILATHGWRGPFNIQLGQTHFGELVAFEINGRFTGSSSTLSALGMQFVPQAINSFVGGHLLPIDCSEAVNRVDKRLHDWPVCQHALIDLTQQGVWSRIHK